MQTIESRKLEQELKKFGKSLTSIDKTIEDGFNKIYRVAIIGIMSMIIMIVFTIFTMFMCK